MTSDEILDLIDLEPVIAAIRAEPIAHWGYEDAAACVWNAASRYFVADLERFASVFGIEQHWALLREDDIVHIELGAAADRAVAACSTPSDVVHGYADLVLEAEDGGRVVVDWKTASALDTAWHDRLVDSWQWRLYCGVYGAPQFLYRGLDKSSLGPRIPGQPYDWSRAAVKELAFTAPPHNDEDVYRWLNSSMAVRDALAAGFPTGRWPRRMPDACRSFGQRCTYWDACRGAAEPTAATFRAKAFSYSGISKLLNCPEHYRLATITGHRESSPATDLGSAVHRGMATLYEQFNHIKGICR